MVQVVYFNCPSHYTKYETETSTINRVCLNGSTMVKTFKADLFIDYKSNLTVPLSSINENINGKTHSWHERET